MNTDVRSNVALLIKTILFPQSLHGFVQISFQKYLLVFTTLWVSVVNLSYEKCINYIIKYNLKTDNDNHFFFFWGGGLSSYSTRIFIHSYSFYQCPNTSCMKFVRLLHQPHYDFMSNFSILCKHNIASKMGFLVHWIGKSLLNRWRMKDVFKKISQPNFELSAKVWTHHHAPSLFCNRYACVQMLRGQGHQY